MTACLPRVDRIVCSTTLRGCCPATATMASMSTPKKPPHRIEISATQLVAGSAAAACGAWLASKIGLAGTVIGAAVVSALVTFLSAVYAQGVRRAREELLVRRELLRARPKLPASYAEEEQVPVLEESAAVVAAQAAAAGLSVHEDVEEDELETTRTMVLPAFQLEDSGGYRWGRIALAALVVFVVAMLVVTVIELVDGHSLTCTTSGKGCEDGTTLLPGTNHPKPTPSKSSTAPTPSTSATPSSTPSTAVSTTPSDTGSPTPTDTASATASPSDSTSPATSSSPPTG